MLIPYLRMLRAVYNRALLAGLTGYVPGLFKHVYTGTDVYKRQVFSMDGNVAPMDKICDLAEKYDALVMVDESHSAGVVGATGPERGLAQTNVVTAILGL